MILTYQRPRVRNVRMNGGASAGVGHSEDLAHGRRVLADNGGAANKQRTAKKEKKIAAALPLKFFNVKTSERFVFKRRDKKCLTLSPRSSLIPVFIHFSDFFPDLVQATLVKCRALIKACERVVILKPNQVKSRRVMCTYAFMHR